MINLKLLFILFTFFVDIYSSKTADDCTKKDVINLKSNEIGFFETINYPNLWSQNEFYSCNLTYLLVNSEQKHIPFVGFNLIIHDSDGAFLVEIVERIILNDTFFTFSDLFQYFHLDEDDTVALQGFVNFDGNVNSGCPMELSANPYEFYDETQIFQIQSSYNESNIRNFSCIWKFVAPSFEYGFKIVFEALNGSSKFIVKNTTQIFVNERSAKILYPYYNEDSFIQILLSPTTFVTKSEFQAYVTVVKKEQPKLKENCTVYKDEKYGIIYWSNVKDEKGYNNNAYCNYKIDIPSNTYVYVIAKVEGLEKGVDFVRYYSDSSNNSVKVIWDSQFGFENMDFNRTIFWEFISDGSYQLIGFEIQFEPKNCQCGDYNIKCDGRYHGIMQKGNEEYCGNLQCIFKILPCKTSLTLLQIQSHNDVLNDVFEVISNNETVMEINRLNRRIDNYDVFLFSSNLNHLIVNTAPTSNMKLLTFTVTSVQPPIFTNRFVLSVNTSKFIIDMEVDKFFTIEISPELHYLNLSIFLYCTDLTGFGIYNNESLTDNIVDKKCFNKSVENRCEIKRNKIAVHVKAVNGARIIVAELNHRSNGCMFSKNAFVITSNSNIASLATFEKYCDVVILLSEVSHTIKTLWTTAQTESVKIFSGTDNANAFLEITSSTARKWNFIMLYSKVYKIRIPKGAAIFLNIVGKDDIPKYSISQYPLKALISTYDYGLPQSGASFEYASYLNVGSTYSAKLTAINYKMAFPDFVYFQDRKTQKNYLQVFENY